MTEIIATTGYDEEPRMNRRTKVILTDKAIRVLGKESLSKEKIMSTLGIVEDELAEAEMDLVERREEELRRKRYLEPLDKKNSHKALGILGHDLSVEKLKSTLGVEESVIIEAQQTEAERQEENIRKVRRNASQMDRKHTVKALGVLGHDPSHEKAKQFLGMDEEDLLQYQEECMEEYEQHLKRKRSRSCINRRSTVKAQRILGIYPSKDKLIDRLGIDTSIVDEAQMERYIKDEEVIKKKRMQDDKVNKKNIQKALKVLGHDPSEYILENRLGIDREEIQKELKKDRSNPDLYNSSSPSLNQKIIITSVVVVIVGFLGWQLTHR